MLHAHEAWSYAKLGRPESFKRVMDFDHAGREAYEAANTAVLESVAVWDGQTWERTAEVVADARERGLPVTVGWPPGEARQ